MWLVVKGKSHFDQLFLRFKARHGKEQAMNQNEDIVKEEQFSWLKEIPNFLGLRLRLLQIEGCEALNFLKGYFLFNLVTCFSFFFTILFGGVAVQVYFWDTPYRVIVSCSIAFGFLIITVLSIFGARGRKNKLKQQIFMYTRQELDKDWKELSYVLSHIQK